MNIRMTQQFTFQQVRDSMQAQLTKFARAQEQIASGNRIQRPSDDPVGTARVLNLEGHLGTLAAQREAVVGARPQIDSAASGLQQATALMSEARAALVNGMNGTLAEGDRVALADQLDGIRESLLSVANTRVGDKFVFGGSGSEDEPFVETMIDGRRTVEYRGSTRAGKINIGNGQTVDASVVGEGIFGRSEPSGVTYSGLTGVAAGSGPNDGTGYGVLNVRHDGTSGALGAGLAFVAAGAEDTMLGDKALTVDITAGTVRLGNGPTRGIPDPLDPAAANFRILDSDGSELHIDFSGYTGAGFSGTVSGAGSISFGGASYETLDFVDADLELTDTEGRQLHIDTRDISRSGEELVTFGGTLSVFDVLAGAADDMRSGTGLDTSGVVQRLNARFADLDIGAEDIIRSLGQLGARSARLNTAEERLDDVAVHLEGIVAGVRDTDIVEAVTQLTQAEQTLQVAQSAAARLLQQSLLNFL